MKKVSFFVKCISCIMICIFLSTGCSGRNGGGQGQEETGGARGIPDSVEIKNPEADAEIFSMGTTAESEVSKPKAPEQEVLKSQGPEPEISESQDPEPKISEPKGQEPGASEPEMPEPETIETDWSEYFDGLNGAAVIYDASALKFYIYNSALAETRRSPCSTFKIISSLTALENGIIVPDDSTREWSGEVFWNEKWNNDIDFRGAFRESCVWYFREVIDETGRELIQEELDRLCYGNCDISDWEGRLNTNNSNRALTGFWLESSLAISPKEQTEVMERIFGEASVYSETVRNELKEVMRVDTQTPELSVYGKTGMGKAEGVTVDAWFAGFAENAGKNIYFCVYLGRTDEKNVTSTAAKEIALGLVSDYCTSPRHSGQ